MFDIAKKTITFQVRNLEKSGDKLLWYATHAEEFEKIVREGYW